MGYQKIFTIAAFLLYFSSLALAEKLNVNITDKSTSGRTVMIAVRKDSGLMYNDPLLIRRGDEKLAAGRVLKLYDDKAAVYIVENYKDAYPTPGTDYNILFGIPMGNIPPLPENLNKKEVTDLEQNPQNERFFSPEGQEINPELTDDSYDPDVRLQPKLPEPSFQTTHNLSLGVALFRDEDVEKANSIPANSGAMTTYQGYAVRYTYNFRTYYWLKQKTEAMLGVEGGMGMYSFPFTLNSQSTRVTVIPLSLNVHYNVDLNPLFRIYPYLGFQHKLVSATGPFPSNSLEGLRKNTLMFGVGAALVMSKAIDVRLDAGIDGVLLAMVTKF